MNGSKSLVIKLGKLIVLSVSFCCTAAHAQVTNGSFEEGGQFSFEGWHMTASECQVHISCAFSSNDVPPDGGTWSLRLKMRNVQGQFMNVAYQLIPEVNSGEIWRLSAWAKQPMDRWDYTRLYWTTFEPAFDTTGAPHLYLPVPHGAVDSTALNEWVMLVVVDTFSVAKGDSVGVVLDAGVSAVVLPPEDWSYFDLVSVEKLGVVGVEPGAPGGGAVELLPPSPNPARDRTSLTFRLPQPGSVRLAVYDVLGREASRLVEEPRGAGYHSVGFDASRLGAGVYLLRLEAEGAVATRKLVVAQ